MMATGPIAFAVAEEVLRRIYGDDLLGCKVSLEEIAAIVEEGLKHDKNHQRELVEMYEKAIEAVDLLSRAPQNPEVPKPEQLRSMLSDRLDAIQQLARKVMDTTVRLQKPAE
ncbi:MAG TPA: hypothetical protein VK850_19780 [Candidatus Binatia bacterium]|nr:hypothetical protein [Candidatus Binatia bacterium]